MSILVLTSDTLIGTPATGNIEYSGQFYGTDSNASRAQIQRITQGTVIPTTSGSTAIFTGIPSWVKRITVILNAVGTNGAAFAQIQVGSGSILATGYTSTSMLLNNTSVGNTSSTTGFIVYPNLANANRTGQYVLTNVSGNIWVCSGQSLYSTTQTSTTNGVVTLSGTLDRVGFTTSDTLNNGSINILYEG